MDQKSNNKGIDFFKGDEIDLFELARGLWSKRGFIIKVTSICLFFSVIIAFSLKNEYVANCKVMPETQEASSRNLGGLSGLAGLAGIDLGGGSSSFLAPQIYPQIVQSAPFQLELIHTPIRFQSLDSLSSSYIYFTEIQKPPFWSYIIKYTIGLPFLLLDQLKEEQPISIDLSEDLIQLSEDDWELLEKYRARISVAVDDETGVISVNSMMPDPYAAAWLTDLVVKKLTVRVTDYTTEKTKLNFDFISERYTEAEKTYQLKQNKLANFRDRNRNLTSALVQTETERLQNEVSIAFEVYKGLASQLEQAKIKIKEDTPVFTVLEPVKIPVKKSEPKRPIYLAMGLILGFGFSIGYLLIKEIIISRLG